MCMNLIYLQKSITAHLEMVNMKTGLLLVFSLFILTNANEECSEEFNGLKETCECEDKRVWCPNKRNEKVQFHLQDSPPGLQILCYDDLNENELRDYAKNVTLTASETSLILKFGNSYCPIPKSYSYGELFQKVESLKIRQSKSENGLIANQFDGLGPSLKKLRLQQSVFKSIDPQAFDGLENLTNLSFVNNYELQNFPNGSELFDPLKNLEFLGISSQNGNIKELQDELLDGLKNLEEIWIDVGANPSARFFKNNVKLERVVIKNLDGDNLIKDGVSMFSAIKSLKKVVIWAPSLANFTNEVFSTNKELDHFSFQYVSKNDKCRRIKEPECRVTKPSSFVKDIVALKTFGIDYSKRGEIVLNNDFFWGCEKLEQIKIIKSQLKIIPNQLLKDTKNLAEIDLSYNEIRSLPPKLFHNVHKLKVVKLKGNLLQEIDGRQFSKSSRLTHLDISNNELQRIAKSAFKKLYDIEMLDLSKNQIYFDDVTKPDLSAMKNLKEFIANNNNISISHIPFARSAIHTSLTKIDLSQNKIGPTLDVWPDLKFQTTQKLKVYLFKNSIEYFNYTSAFEEEKFLRQYQSNEAAQDVEIDISDNPIKCDCHNFDLARHLSSDPKLALESSVTNWFKFTKSSSIREETCAFPPFSCKFPSENLYDKCPDSCLCSYIPYVSLDIPDYSGHIIVNCSGHGIETNSNEVDYVLPDFIPTKLRMKKDMKLITLNLSHKQLTSLNNITKIPGYLSVTELDVSYNNLQELPESDSKSPFYSHGLKKIHLNHNHLTNINPQIIQTQFAGLEKLWLGENPFSCDCDSLDLYKFIKSKDSTVQDSVLLNCTNQDNNMVKISSIKDESYFCTDKRDIAIAIVLPIFIVALIMLFLVVLILTYRDTISILIYNNPWLRPLLYLYEDNSDKRFDVFVSYSHLGTIHILHIHF